MVGLRLLYTRGLQQNKLKRHRLLITTTFDLLGYHFFLLGTVERNYRQRSARTESRAMGFGCLNVDRNARKGDSKKTALFGPTVREFF